MPRKRTKQSPKIDARMTALIAAGGTAESIAKALKAAGVKGVSRATIGRRLLEARGKSRVGRVRAAPTTKKPRASAPAASAPTSEDEPDVESELPLPRDPSEIPEGLSLDMLHRLLQKADRAASHALAKGDLATFGAMGRLVTSISEAIRKATPPPEADPNESPDMRAAAKRARDTLHRIVSQVIGRVDG